MSQYEGLVAATVTPTNQDGSVNINVIPRYIDYLINNGIHAVFLNGATGEWPSFSTNERKEITEAWLHHGREKLKYIIVQCGALSISDSKDMAKHAALHGADAIACLTPNYLKPHSTEHIVEYLSEVANSAENCAFLYYHVPGLTKLDIDMKKFLTIANRKIQNFSGLKLSTLDFIEVYTCLEFDEKHLAVYYGFDEQLLPALVMGVKSAIGNFYNFLGAKSNKILEDFKNGELESARASQIQIMLDFIPLFKEYGDGLNRLLITLFSGIEMGPARLPMKPIFTKNVIEYIRTFLKEKGYIVFKDDDKT